MIFLNDKLEKLPTEIIVDVYTEMGAYCGSFVMPNEQHIESALYMFGDICTLNFIKRN